MEPIIPLIRDLTQPLHRELPRRETRDERDTQDVGVQPLVQPLQRNFDGTAFTNDDDE